MAETVKGVQAQVEIAEYTKERLESKCNSTYNRLFKRLIGLVLSLILFVLLSPVLLVISIAIIIDSGFPIFYKADRGGYKGKSFKIYKFRSMVKNADKIGGGTTALNDSRITKVGCLLRKTKMDEIPQLINIIKGEMSFIGPRPELLRYTSQYDDVEKYILQVRPGITDYSSIEFINLDEIVGGENADEMYEKYVLKRKNSLRVKYVASISFAVDCKLFFMTVAKTIDKATKIIFGTGGINGKNLSQ
jgi:lipopolysaccharide/colanic/teichoic acid biosynthesis glycosyltransferase